MAVGAARQLRDESEELARLQLREARKLPGWDDLSRTDKHVARWLIRLGRARSGETFRSEEGLAARIPPAPMNRRPNSRGHIHRSTLRASLARIERAGIFTSWRTNGKRLPNGLRTPSIRVWRLDRTAWGRAWATLKHSARRNLYTVRAEAYVKEGERGREQFRGGWKVPLWHRDNDSSARHWATEADEDDRRAGKTPPLPSELLRWAVNRLTIGGVGWLFGERAAVEYTAYLDRDGLEAAYEASLLRAGLIGAAA